MAMRQGRRATTGFLRDFQAFALKGNVVDLAVAVIIGGAFGKIVSSFVADLVMPLVNPLIPGGDWRAAVIGPGLKVGSFLGSVVDFVIIALVLFVAIRALERWKHQEEAAAPAPEPDPAQELQARLVTTLERLADVLEKQDD
ncbi:MAG: large conductance mechanosensitive channel protein MscL [Gloeomargaritaceae cyanobacterium C42_A2020_066]|nr:large conductance mechanosensitive channel protein MscL [Gloeomargaritaceae cyanobacterium C42_A2020_066]